MKKPVLSKEEQAIVKSAVFSSMWITGSPHEWSWTQEEQENMARGVLILHSLWLELQPPYTMESCSHRKKYCQSNLCKKCYDRLAQRHKRIKNGFQVRV